MSERTICDRCGKAKTPAAELSITITDPQASDADEAKVLFAAEHDVCLDCWPALRKVMEERIVLEATPPDTYGGLGLEGTMLDGDVVDIISELDKAADAVSNGSPPEAFTPEYPNPGDMPDGGPALPEE